MIGYKVWPPSKALYFCSSCDKQYSGFELEPLVIDGETDWLDPRCPKGHCCLVWDNDLAIEAGEAAEKWVDANSGG